MTDYDSKTATREQILKNPTDRAQLLSTRNWMRIKAKYVLRTWHGKELRKEDFKTSLGSGKEGEKIKEGRWESALHVGIIYASLDEDFEWDHERVKELIPSTYNKIVKIAEELQTDSRDEVLKEYKKDLSDMKQLIGRTGIIMSDHWDDELTYRTWSGKMRMLQGQSQYRNIRLGTIIRFGLLKKVEGTDKYKLDHERWNEFFPGTLVNPVEMSTDAKNLLRVIYIFKGKNRFGVGALQDFINQTYKLERYEKLRKEYPVDTLENESLNELVRMKFVIHFSKRQGTVYRLNDKRVAKFSLFAGENLTPG